MRAYFYFYLVNLYGQVPLAITSNYQTNSALRRAPLDIVYDQIIADLVGAETLLSLDYLDGTLTKYQGKAERLRPTRWAASAMLARVYLYKETIPMLRWSLPK